VFFSLGSLCPLWFNEAMSASSDSRVSVVLQAAQAGDRQAAADLLPLVYAELRELARARLARRAPGQTLTPTALVHEAYVRIAGDSAVTWEGRQHFFFAAARAMRNILVEQARRKAAPKHGGGRNREELDEACAVLQPRRKMCSRCMRRLRSWKGAIPSRRRLSFCGISRV
jgi:RNA polymerase sigma factor (TIGR02999 family)